MNNIVIDKNYTSLRGKYCSVDAIFKKKKNLFGVKMKETLASCTVKTHVCFTVLCAVSVLSMSQSDINRVSPGQLHNQVQREKQERAHILTMNQELARQVTQQSKKAAGENLCCLSLSQSRKLQVRICAVSHSVSQEGYR